MKNLSSVSGTWDGPQDQTTGTDGSGTPQRVDLNPRFVEALMGVPPNWLTPSTSVGMASYRRWLRRHSWLSLNGLGRN